MKYLVIRAPKKGWFKVMFTIVDAKSKAEALRKWETINEKYMQGDDRYYRKTTVQPLEIDKVYSV